MNKKFYTLGIGILILSIAFIIITTRSRATSLFSPADLTPTVIPPDVLTRIAQDEASISATQTAYPPIATQFIQTEQALQLTLAAAPTEDMQIQYGIFYITPSIDEILYLGKQNGTLAGYGILLETQESTDTNYKYRFNGLVWQESTHHSSIWVTGGRSIEFPDQGAIRLSISTNSYSSDVVIESPVQAGELTITGAVGERLILTSVQGQTFYFDVPARRFVDGLDEIVPTATPHPTLTPEFPPDFTDDAANEPLYVYDYQLEYADLNYYINSPEDKDWFWFISQTEGILNVSLAQQGKNYGLRVVFVNADGNGPIIVEDTTAGDGKKQVTIQDAPSGNYMVRVWSLDGSYDEVQPYTLRFEPPKPETIRPILECVAENADGTFTAHFGYENPNSYVVSIFAERDTSFRPEPIFRAGQPQYFAPGRVEDLFRVLFDGNDLTWRLNGLEVTANRNSPRCP